MIATQKLIIKKEKLATRCEICHKPDNWNAKENFCKLCDKEKILNQVLEKIDKELRAYKTSYEHNQSLIIEPKRLNILVFIVIVIFSIFATLVEYITGRFLFNITGLIFAFFGCYWILHNFTWLQNKINEKRINTLEKRREELKNKFRNPKTIKKAPAIAASALFLCFKLFSSSISAKSPKSD